MLSFLQACLDLPLQCSVCDWSISHLECLVCLEDEFIWEGNICSSHLCGAEYNEELFLLGPYQWL